MADVAGAVLDAQAHRGRGRQVPVVRPAMPDGALEGVVRRPAARPGDPDEPEIRAGAGFRPRAGGPRRWRDHRPVPGLLPTRLAAG